MRKKDILLVEDELTIAESIKARLERGDEFAVDIVATGYGALRSLGTEVPDAVLLDATLPDLSGTDVCRVIRARERTARLPVIILGEQLTGVGPIHGLELGADDYVVKSLDLRELEARLRAVLRRHVHQQYPEQDRFNGAHIDANFDDVSIAVDGRQISLTKREFLVLRFLVHNRNQTIGRARLANVWGSDSHDCRVVDSAIWKLRAKLKQAGRQIETVVGHGYRFYEPPKDP